MMGVKAGPSPLEPEAILEAAWESGTPDIPVLLIPAVRP